MGSDVQPTVFSTVDNFAPKSKRPLKQKKSYFKLLPRDSLLVRAPDSWSKGCEFESRQDRRENFLLQSQLCVLTLVRCPFHPHVTPVTRKRPRSFCPKCRWQVTSIHTYILDPRKSKWADYAAVQAQCGNLSENERARNLATLVSAR